MAGARGRGSRRREAGFTLIEVMASLAIFAFGLLAVSRMQLLGMRGHDYSRGFEEASYLATEMFELLNNYAATPSNFVNGVFQVPQQAVAAWQVEAVQALGPSSVALVSPAQYDPTTRMNQVTISVSWKPGHWVDLTTYLAAQM